MFLLYHYSKLICAIERKVSFYDFKKFESCPHAEPLTPDIASCYLGSHAKLINTPGHSDDSISIILDDRIIFLGDSAVNVFGNKYPPFADDEILLKKTWAELLEIEAALYCPAHGKPFKRADFIKAYQKL